MRWKFAIRFSLLFFLFPGAEMWRWFCKIAGGREEEEEGEG